MEMELRAVQGSEIVHGCLRPADKLEGSVFFQEHFSAAQFAVVVIAHGVAVGTGIVEHQDVADIDAGKAALDGELVVVLTQAAMRLKWRSCL